MSCHQLQVWPSAVVPQAEEVFSSARQLDPQSRGSEVSQLHRKLVAETRNGLQQESFLHDSGDHARFCHGFDGLFRSWIFPAHSLTCFSTRRSPGRARAGCCSGKHGCLEGMLLRRAGLLAPLPWAHKGRVCALASGPTAFESGQGSVPALRVMLSALTWRRGEPSRPPAPHDAR